MTPRLPAMVGALLALNFALVFPDRTGDIALAAFARIAVETVVVVLALRIAARPWVTHAVAAVLTFTIVLKLANMAAVVSFGRNVDPMVDIALVPAGWDLVVRSNGLAFACLALAAGLVALSAIYLGLRHAARITATTSWRVPLALAAAAAALITIPVTRPLVSATTTLLVAGQIRTVAMAAANERAFARGLAETPAAIPPENLLSQLRGRDVLVVFLESYGRVVFDAPRYRAALAPQLAAFEQRLAAKGFGAHSAWVTSPTFGGQSWFAHSTLISGLWISDQRRYDALVASGRSTLIHDFHRAGWRTVGVMPEITADWPEATVFGYDAAYLGPTLGFAGSRFSYATIADQYTLAQVQTRELGPTPRPPVMAEIALVTSHAPWTPLPKVIPWEEIGDGSVFDVAREGASAEEVWADPEAVREQYARAISYVLAVVESFVLTFGTDNTVVLLVGDHQPMGFIAGEDAPRDVPAHIIARDPAVLAAAAAAWRWTPGLQPNAQSPVWRMDEIRSRLIGTFSTPP